MNDPAGHAARLRRWPPGVAYVLAILALVGLGSLAGVLAGSGNAWYQSLEKSVLTPPGAAFAVIWPLLYALMAVAAVMVWRADAAGRGPALVLFFLQLAVNYAWSFIFFSAQLVGLALGWIAGLIVLVGLTMRAFHGIRPAAAWLMAPYLAWLLFAAYLNAGIWWLN